MRDEVYANGGNGFVQCDAVFYGIAEMGRDADAFDYGVIYAHGKNFVFVHQCLRQFNR